MADNLRFEIKSDMTIEAIIFDDKLISYKTSGI